MIQSLISVQYADTLGATEPRRTGWYPSLEKIMKIMKTYKIGRTRMKRLAIAKWRHSGPSPPAKQYWTGNIPPNALSLYERKAIRNSVLSAEHEPFPLMKREGKSVYLPVVTTIKSLYHRYAQSCQDKQIEPCSRSTFYKYFPLVCPEVFIGRPMADVCNICMEFRVKPMSGSSMPETRKNFELHKQESTKRREIYKKDCAAAWKDVAITSFDYKQNLLLPYPSCTSKRCLLL